MVSESSVLITVVDSLSSFVVVCLHCSGIFCSRLDSEFEISTRVCCYFSLRSRISCSFLAKLPVRNEDGLRAALNSIFYLEKESQG